MLFRRSLPNSHLAASGFCRSPILRSGSRGLRSFSIMAHSLKIEEVSVDLPWLSSPLRGKLWRDASRSSLRNSADCSRKMLCLHGWLDNAASFDRFAPCMAREGYEVLALDLPGHGRSGHKLSSNGYIFFDHCDAVTQAAAVLGWDKFTLVGHSMGGHISVMIAGAFPEMIQRLVILESFGPIAVPEESIPKTFRRHVRSLARLQEKKKKVYASAEAAVRSRVDTVRSFPGKQWLSLGAARLLIQRGVLPAAVAAKNGEQLQTGLVGADQNLKSTENLTGSQDKHPAAAPSNSSFSTSNTSNSLSSHAQPEEAVVFAHDPLVNASSPVYMSESQVLGVIRATRGLPVLLAYADSGWPMDPAVVQGRLEAFGPSLATQEIKQASHHFHLDEENAQEVVDCVKCWLARKDQEAESDQPSPEEEVASKL